MPRLLPVALLIVTALTTTGAPALAARDSKAGKAGGSDDAPLLSDAAFSGLKLRSIGPALLSGRIADIAIHPGRQSTWYVAAGSGGVWKTTNAGTTWTPLFDGEASYSIGCVTLDPSNPETVWVGSGENVSGRHVGFGDGVYRSLDGGKSWENMGLKQSQHIARILVDPRDSKVVYVAAEGPLWTPGGERGVYKTTDGGQTWTVALSIGEDTGVTSLELDPRNPDVLYAAAYQRRRSVWAFMAGGPESGIYKSTDAGATWRALKNGLPKGDVGKIGLAVSPLDPDVVYATVEAAEKDRGLYRSADAGESWKRGSKYVSGGTGPHYYQEIYASPHKLDRLYQMDVWIHISEDGGESFKPLGEKDKHSDNHALAFDPADPDYLLAGSDGGLYQTWDHGATWSFVGNLPLTQIYKLSLDNATPFYNVAGGTQDNGTQVGPSRTTNVHGIRNLDWEVPLGADGHACQFDPQDPNILYAEWQRGNLVRYDRRTGEALDVQPQPAPGDDPERYNWDAPILVSPHANTRLYFGSQRLWKSDDRGDSWTAISPDLSRGKNRYTLPLMGAVPSVDDLYDNGAMSWYGSLTAIAESPRVEGLIYVGTDDGLIQVTEDGGKSWRKVDAIRGVPDGFFVNELKASLHDPDTVFAVVDQHKTGDFSPYLFKSSDRGRRWTSISGDLPERHILWSVEQDHVRRDLLFVGSEFGLHFTLDGGQRWMKLSGAPTIAFRDLEIQRRENDLVGATFGRGFYILDDYAALREVTEEALKQEAHLFPVKDALLYVPAMPLAVRDQGYEGSARFAAENPPFGAVFTYHLKTPPVSAKEAREEREKQLRKEGADIPFPGLEALERERREDEPKILLTVTDDSGAVVRRIVGPAKAGFQRVAWDLRYPPHDPIDLAPPRDLPPWASPPAGPLVVPGRYTVQLSKLVDAQVTALGAPQSFRITALDRAALPGQDPQEILAFQRQTADLERKLQGSSAELRRAGTRLSHIKQALLVTPGADAALLRTARELEDRMAALRQTLSGDPTLRRLNEPTAPSLSGRVGQIVGGHWDSMHGPTRTHRDNYDIAAKAYAEFADPLRQIIEVDLVRLEEQLEAAGAPWTPGRPLPGPER